VRVVAHQLPDGSGIDSVRVGLRVATLASSRIYFRGLAVGHASHSLMHASDSDDLGWVMIAQAVCCMSGMEQGLLVFTLVS
jgi:hypothetical protein